MQNVELTRVKPAEAGRISALSVDLQRDWRKRGYLPKGVGHARFDAFEVAEMTILRKLSDRGIGPKVSSRWASLAAASIVSQALKSPNAYEVDRDSDDLVEMSRMLTLIRHATERGFSEKELNVVYAAVRFFVWWPDDDFDAGNSLDELIANRPASKPAGPIVFLDIHAEASDLLREFGYLVV